jgi:hypothetical protein
MSIVRCNACGGVYDTKLADGTPYFHACPQLELVIVTRAGLYLELPVHQIAADDVVLRRRFVPRPNGRDENLRIDPETKKTVAIAAGAGSTPIKVYTSAADVATRNAGGVL